MDSRHPNDSDFAERRGARRHGCTHGATVRGRGRFAVTARIADLTVDGCRVEGAGPFDAGGELWVRLPGLESQAARTIWSRDGGSGALFERPLHPAVLARFLPAASRMTLVASCDPAALAPDPSMAALSRRERIVRGVATLDQGALLVAKRRSGGGLSGAIRRQVQRDVNQRREERFADTVRTGPMQPTIRGLSAAVRNVSASGLKLGVFLKATIGELLPVEFAGFPPLEARIVWLRPDEVGISLPPTSIALTDH